MKQEEEEDGSLWMHGNSTRNVQLFYNDMEEQKSVECNDMEEQKRVECNEEDGAGDCLLANDYTHEHMKLANTFYRFPKLEGCAHEEEDDDNDIPSCSSLKLESFRPPHPKNNVCSICRKSFPSTKSLSGHMRCHPKRGWRGIQPPPPPSFTGYSLSSTIDTSADGKMDDSLTKKERRRARSPSTWSVTRKRSQRVAISPAAVEGDCSQDDASDAVDVLLHLAGSDLLHSPPLKKDQRNEALESGDAGFVPTRANIHGDNEHDIEENIESQSAPVSTIAGLKKRAVPGDSKKQNREEEGEAAEGKKVNYYKHRNQKNGYMNEKSVKKKTKKVKDMMSLAEKKYVCSTCNKSFPSYQALGGHRASHKKLKNDSLMNVTVQGEVHTISFTSSPTAPSKHLMNHKCNICNKEFPTGHALGADKRFHWLRTHHHPATTLASASPGRQPHNFDLNQLPDCDDSPTSSA